MCQAKKSFDSCMEIDETIETNDPDSPQPSGSSTTSRRASGSSSTSYETSRDYVCCIICATDQTDSHGKLIPVHTMEMPLEGQALHQGKLQLVEFVEIHQN